MNYCKQNESLYLSIEIQLYWDMVMELFDSINIYLINHPVMLDQLELAFRIKYWLLSGLAIYFVTLPYRVHKQEIRKQKKLSKTRDHFLA